MSRIKNFKGKGNTNGFDKNKDNINKNGRPKKLLNTVIEQLKQNGLEKATKSNISDIIALLLNMGEEDLKNMLIDTNNPMIIRIIIKNILNNKGFETINILFDRVYGKATQTVNNLNLDINNEIDVLKDKLKDLK